MDIGRTMTIRKTFWWIGIAVLVGLAAVYYWTRSGSANEATYRFEKIDRGDIVVAISATGALNAVTTVQVGSQVSGTIAKLYVDFNAIVKEGQLLAQLDPTFLQASLSEQRANVDRATAQVNEAQRNLKRTNELFSKGMVSQTELDASTTALETAEAGVRQAEATRDRAEVNLKYATIRAPISGVVISRNVDVGQTVAASLSAPTLFTIANDLSKMQVTASVDEADIGQVKIGQQVTFRVDAYAEDEFVGTVSQIRLAPVIAQNVVTYNVIIDVDNPGQKLMPGMTATCSIQVARRDNVLRVPLGALRFTPADWKGGADRTALASSANGVGSGNGQPRAEGMPRPVGSDSSQRPARGNRQGDSTSRPGGPGDGGQWMHTRPDSTAGHTGNGMTPARLWMIENGALKPLRVLRGLQNQRYAEILNDSIKEGDSVIVGTNSTQAQAAPTGQNPFIPRMPGGGGQRGGR